VRYELLKSTGKTIYIPLRGYDPTDILRGDYVNLSYELPYSGSTQSYSSEQQYLIPTITGTTVTGIEKITTTKPQSGIYFQIRNGWEDDGGNYRFQTTATDRWFVREWTGLDIEKQIRDGEMYGEWKVGSNGAVIITNIVSKEKLPK
jgi:uncharacterized membrane-anchored protein